jgi:hypothetical protein
MQGVARMTELTQGIVINERIVTVINPYNKIGVGLKTNTKSKEITIFKHSPISQKIYDFYNGKYGMGWIGLVKCCSVASLKVENEDAMPVSILDVSPSGNYKSRSSSELREIFPEDYTYYLGSDVTIHGIINETENGEIIDSKAVIINDLVLTLETKTSRGGMRLICGLAELLSDGIYKYSDRNDMMAIEARISIVANMTRDKYLYNPRLFQGTTFEERMLVLHHSVDTDVQKEFFLDRANRFTMSIGERVEIEPGRIAVTRANRERAVNVAEKWRLFAMSPSLSRVGDKVYSLLLSHALLNGRDHLCEDDWLFLEKIQPYLMEPTMGKKHIRVLLLYNEGKSVDDIAGTVDYSKENVYKILDKYRKRGVIQ